MLKRVVSVLCIFILIFSGLSVSLAELPPEEQRDEEGPGYGSTPSSGSTMYVYTANGKTLHLREKGKTGAKILREIPWGAQVKVLKSSGSWSKVTYSGTTGYVVSKYLVSKRPTRRPSSKKSSSKADPTPTPLPVRLPDSLSGITDETLDQTEPVDLEIPEEVTIEPLTDDPDVPLFSEMTLESKMLHQYSRGDHLRLVSKNENWGLVIDATNNLEGYMLLDWLVPDLIDEEILE